MPIEQQLVIGAILLLLSIAASKASARLGVPALLLFLLIGMLAGSEGPGNIPFDNYELTQAIGVLALVFILFSGGLDTDWQHVRPVVVPAVVLATIGVLLTALLVGGFAIWLLGFSLLEGMLLGAIVSSTDAAAVFAVLRSRGAGLKSPIAPLIELESGSNDPMAVFLTTSLVQMIMTPASASLWQLIPLFFQQMVLGGLAGAGMGRGMAWLINRSRLEYEGLYPVLSISLVMLTYGVTAAIGGNGFLAVYVAGLILGNSNFVHHRSLMRFHDGIAWLMQIAMFLALGLLVFPSQVVPLVGVGVLVSLFLMFVARPVSVFLSLFWTNLGPRATIMIGWVGLRGAVPIILATFPLLAGVPQASLIFNLVFFIVLTSVLVQGTSLPIVARWLGVAAPTQPPVAPQTFVPRINVESRVLELRIPPTSPAVRKTLIDLNLPAGALVVLIERDGRTVVPHGGIALAAGDTLLVVTTLDALTDVTTRLGLDGEVSATWHHAQPASVPTLATSSADRSTMGNGEH
jgi:potassium/hydrogen antiporter